MTGSTVVVTGLRQVGEGKTLVDISSLTLGPTAEGVAVAVLGPNGAGKSTLLRMLATVTSPDAGGLHVDGLMADDPNDRTAIRRRLGYLGQVDALPHRMRVDDYLDYVGALKEIGPERLRRQWTTWALDRVDLAANRRARIKTLSGGMRRRVAFAQALLGGPDLYVLDEPLTSLDAEHRGRITRLIAELAQDATVIVATHHADELATVCHRAVVLVEGKVCFDGEPAVLAARAEGRVWETSAVVEGAECRAVGPGRYRCVAESMPMLTASPPSGPAEPIEPVEPTVADGYTAVVRYGA